MNARRECKVALARSLTVSVLPVPAGPVLALLTLLSTCSGETFSNEPKGDVRGGSEAVYDVRIV